MHRIDGDGAVTDQNGAGKDGFNDTYPNRTVVKADWANDVQETLAQYIESRGIALVKGTFTQLIAAIATHFPASSTDNHIVRFNGTTGKIVQDASPVSVTDGGAIEGVSNVSLTGDVFYDAPKARTLTLSALHFDGVSGAASTQVAGIRTLTTNSGYYQKEFSLPAGSVITAVRALADPGVQRAGTDRMNVQLASRTGISFSSPSHGSAAGIGSAGFDSGVGHALQQIAQTGLSETVVAGVPYYVVVQAGNTANANNDILGAIQIDYTDAGPKNLG